MSALRRRPNRRLLTTSAFGALALAVAWAAPARAQLVQGATPAQSNGTAPVIDQSVPNATTVTLGGSRTVIDWDKFDINSGDTANFVFANRSDIVLNRVGGAGSTINGNLNGTIGSAGGATGGNIWIYNANGVVIGANARISTGGLLVTTAAVDRATDSSAGGFLDGSASQFGFTGSASGAGITVQNGAQITSHGGAIALVSTSVTTEAGSSISAQDGGNVLYGAAAKYKISFARTGADDLDLLSFEVASGADGTASTANGGNLLQLGGATSGNRVFAALVSKTNVFSRLLSSGTITATSAALDETGAIVLTTNHNIVNGAASATAVANNGGADIATGGSITAPAVSMVSSDSITTIGTSISAVGGTIDMLAENGVLYGDGDYTAGTLTARAQGDINLWTGLKNIGSIGGLRSDSGSIIFTNRMSATIDGDIIAAGTANITIEGIAGGSGLIKAARAQLNGDGVFHLDSATTLDFLGASNDLTVTSNGDLNLNLSGGTGNDMATVTLQALSGSIRQTDSGYGLAGTVVAQALDDIDLGGSGNNFSSITAGSSNGGDVTLRSARGFSVAGISSGAFNLVSDTGDITGNGVNIGGLTASAAGNIDFSGASNAIRALGDVNAGGDVLVSTTTGLAVDGAVHGGTLVTLHANGGNLTQGAGSLISGKGITVTASGSILQDEDAVIHGTGLNSTSTTVQAGGDLILAGANQLSDYGNAFLGWGSGGDVTYRSAHSLFFNGGATPIGALTLIADNGNIQQGSIAFTADTLTARATQGVELGTAAPNTIDHLGDISGGTGDVSLTVGIIGSATPTTIDGTISSASRVLLSMHGVVSGTGTISAPQTYLDASKGGVFNIAGSTTLVGLGTGNGDLTVNATGGLAVNTTVAGNNHAITLNAAAGDIVQTGGTVVATSLLTLNASGDIDFGAGSYISDLVAGSTGGGAITLSNAGSTNLAVSTTGAVDLIGGSYNVAGASHAGTLTATLGGDLTLDMSSVGSFGALSAGGDLMIVLDGDIRLTDTVTAGNSLLLNSRNGALLQTGGTISLGTGFAFEAATGIDLNQTGNHLGNHLGTSSVFGANGMNVVIRGDWVNAGFYGAFGDVSLYAESGDVVAKPGLVANSLTVEAAGDIAIGSQDFKADVTTYHRLSGTNITVWNDGDFTVDGDVGRAGGVVTLIAANGTLTQGAGTIFGADISLRATNSVLQSSDASVQVDIGGIFLGDSGADLKLLGANRLEYNSFNWGANATVTIHSVGDLAFDTFGTNASNPAIGALTLISDEGSVFQWGSFNAASLNVQAHGNITLDDTAPGVNKVGSVTGLTSTTGNISFKEDDGFTIDGNISAAGNISLNSGGAIEANSGTLSLGGTLAVTAGGDVALGGLGTIKLGAVDTTPGSGGSFFLTTDGDIDLTGTVNTGSKNLTLESTAGAITSHGGTVSTQYNGFGGIVTAYADGGIDLTGVGTAVFWATSTGGGDIKLSSDNDLGFMVNTTGDVTVTAGGWAGNNSDVVARSLGISAGTGIVLTDQGTNIDVGSYRYLTVADGYIDIENQRDIKLDGNVTVGGSDPNNWVRLNSTNGSILQNSGTIKGYQVELKATGSVTQDAAAKVVTGDYGLVLTGTDVSLRGANEISSIQTYSVSRDLTLRNTGSIYLSGNQVTSTGDFDLTSDTGSISGTVQANKLTATATNGSINFGPSPGSTILQLGTLTAKNTGGDDIYIYSNSLLELTDNITGGGVKIYATGGINQTGGAITADRLYTGTAGNLLLGGANDFGTLLDFGHANTGTVTIRNRGDIALPSTPNSFGALTLTSDQGSISQASAITASTLNVHAATGIDLSNTSNNFTTVAGLAITGATGDIRIGDISGFAIEGNITAANGLVALRSTGAITTGTTTVGSVTTPHGKIDADTLSIGGGTSVTLWTTGDIKLGAITLGNGLTLTADNNIELTGTLAAIGTSLNAVAGSITENGGKINVTTGAFLAAGAITLGGDNRITNFNATSNGGGNVSFNNGGTGASVVYVNTTGDAAVTIGGNFSSGGITADDLSVTAGAIDLTNNVSVNSFSKLVASTGDINVANAHGFSITGNVSGASQVRLLTNNGAIAQTAGTITGGLVALQGSSGVTQSGTAAIHAGISGASFTGANLDLRGDNQFAGDISIQTPGNVQLNGDRLRLSFLMPAVDVTLTATGDITGAGAIQASSLTAAAGGQIDLEDPGNAVGTIHGLSGTSVAFMNSVGFAVDGDVTAGTGSVFLDATTGDLRQTGGTISGGSVSLYADVGSVEQSGTGKVLASSLLSVIAGGHMLLGGANDFAYAASGFRYGSGADVTIRNRGSINFNVGPNGSINALNLISDEGAITQAGAVSASRFAASAKTGITFANAGNSFTFVDGLANSTSGGINFKNSDAYQITGDITAAGQTVTLASVNGYFAQDFNTTTAALLNLSANGVIRLHGTVDALGTITNQTNYVILALTGDVALTGNIQASNFQLTTTGNINQTGGAIKAGDLYLSAASTITALANNDVDTVQLKATGTGAIQFNSLGNLVVKDGTANSAGLLDIRASGDIFVDAQIQGLTANELALHAGGDISFQQDSDIHVGTVKGLVSDTGDIEYRDYHGIVLDGNVSAAGAVTLISYLNGMGGAVTQQSGTITADTLNVQAGTQSANFSQGNHVANLGDVNAQSFTYNNADDLAVMGTANVNAGAFELHSDGALSQGPSGVILAGTLVASAGGNLSLISTANRVGTVLGLRGTGVSFVSGASFTLDGDVTATTGNAFVVASGGDLSQTGGTVSGNAVTLRADTGSLRQSGTGRFVATGNLMASAAGDLLLGGANDFNDASATFHYGSVDDVMIRNLGGIAFTGGTAGALTLISDTGAITQTGAITANSLNASSGTGITLDHAGNAIGAIGAMDGGTGDVDFRSAIAYTLLGNVVGDHVTLNGDGAIAQTAGTITANHFTANGAALSFISQNDIGEIDVVNASAGDARVYNSGDLVIGGHVSATGTANLASNSGSIYGPGYVTADKLSAHAAFDITLDNDATDFNVVSLNSGRDVSITDLDGFGYETDIIVGNALTLNLGTGSLTATAGYISAARVNITSDGGSATILGDGSGPLPGLGDIALGTGSLTVAGPGSGDLTLGGNIVAGLVSLSTNGKIIQDSGTVTANTLRLHAGSDMTFNSANSVGTISTGGMASSGDLFFRNDGNLIVDGINVSGRDVNLVSNTGSVTGGAIFAGTLRASAATGIDLYGPVLILRGLTSTAGGVTFTNGNSSLDIDGDIDSGTGVTTLNANGGIYQTAGIITAGGLSLNASGDVDLGRQNQVAGLNAVNTGSGYFHFTNTGDIVIGGGWNVGGDIALTSGGAISQTAGIGTSLFSASAVNGIRLDYFSNEIGAFGTLSNSGTGGIYLADNAGFTVTGDITAAGQTVELYSNGSIAQNGGTRITAAKLRSFGYSYVSLTSVTNNVGEINLLGSTGDLTFTNAGGFSLTGDLYANGRQLSLTSVAGGITQSAGTISVGNVVADAAGSITLGRSNNIGSTTASTFTSASGAIRFHSANAILLGAVSAPGLLSLTADAGGITQTVGISAGGLSASTLGTGDIVFDQANTIGTVRNVSTNGSFTFNTSGDLMLDGTISAPDLVKLTADGDITQVGLGAIHSDLLQATSGAGAVNGISLLGQNDVAQALLNSSGKDLRFRNTGDFELGNISAAGHIVEMISDGGAVTQLAGTSILAGTFSATGTNVVLDNTGNQISRIGLISTGSDLNLRNTVALQIDRIDAAGHTVTINNGDNVTGGNITADKLTIGITGGYVDLSTASHVASFGGFNGGQLTFVNDGSFTISGAIQNGMYQSFLTSQNGAISMAAGGAVNSGGVTLQAATGISITGNLSYVYGATTTAGNVSILSTLLELQGDVSGDTVTLGGTANGGFVGQTSGSITANVLNASGNAYVDLSGATNHIGALGTVSSAGNVSISSLDGFTLTGNIDSGNLVTLNAGGAVSQTGGRIQGWGLNVTAAGDLDLGATNLIVNNGDVTLAGDNVTFVNDGTFTVAGITAASTGAIDLRSVNGSILQSGAMSGGSLTASAHGALTLGQYNSIGTIGKLSAGTNLTYAGFGSFDLTDDVTAGGSVTLDSAGDITQSGGIITADTLNVRANKAVLSQANQVAKLGWVSMSSYGLSFRNVGDIDLSDSVNSSHLGLYSDTGGITQSGGSISATTIDMSAAGNIELLAGSYHYIDQLVSANGDITLRNGGSIDGAGLISAAHGTVDISASAIRTDAVVADRLTVNANAFGDIVMLGANRIGEIGDVRGMNVSLGVDNTVLTGQIQAGQSLTFAGSTSATSMSLTQSAGAGITTPKLTINDGGLNGDVLLSQPIHSNTGTLELHVTTGGNADIRTDGAINLFSASVGGDLSLRAADSILTGGIGSKDVGGTLSAVTSGNYITLQFGTVGHVGDLSSAYSVSLTGANLDLTGAVNATTLSLNAYAGSLTQSAGSSITATTLTQATAADGDLLLNGSNSIGTIYGLSASGDLSYRSIGALYFAGSIYAGANATVSLTAGGDISGTGAIIGGTLNVDAAGHMVSLGMPNVSNSILALGDVTADSFELYNTGNLDLSGTQNVTGTLGLAVNGALTQSSGGITADRLNLNAASIDLRSQNQVNTLSVSATPTGFVRFANLRDLTVDGTIQAGGDLSLNVDGDLTAASGLFANGALDLRANGVEVSQVGSDGSLSIWGGAHAVNLGLVSSSGTVSVTGDGSVTVGAIEITGDGVNALLSGQDVTLGAASGPITGANYVSFGGTTPGAVSIQASGTATVRIADTNMAIGIAATGDVNAEANNRLLLGNVSGANITLLADSLSAGAIATPGTLSLTASDIGAFSIDRTSDTPLDILITDTVGDLTLDGDIVARRNTTVNSVGNIVGGTARLGAGLTMDGTLTVNGGDIALAEASSLYDVVLNGTGTVDVGTVYVGRDYALTGNSFAGSALAPIGTQTGTWTLTGLSDLDLGAATIQYKGGIDFHVDGMLSNGTIQSLTGAVTGSAGVIDVYELLAATDIDATSTAGAFHIFHANAGTGDLTLRGQLSLTVDGSVEAAGDVGLTAQFGPTTIGYASAGGNISVFSLFGNATLRQATLTGVTGNLSVQSVTGVATLGADDYASIDIDHYLERAAGSTGTVSVVGSSAAHVNLDHSATLDLVRASNAEVNVLDGDLTIKMIDALGGTASAYLENGSLTVNSAFGNLVDLEASGDLTLGGGTFLVNNLYLTSGGLIDTTAQSVLTASNLIDISGGALRAASLSSGGDVNVLTATGGITIDELGAGGDASVLSAGDLAINKVSLVGGGQFGASGTATVRSLIASDGFALVALGNVTLGADAGTVADAGNIVETGGTLAGCGCGGTGGGTVVSLGGNVGINLFSVTGVFDAVASDTGNVDVRVAQGDLGIYTLAGHDIVASAAGVLTIMDAESSGGIYSLTAADFGGNALSPVFGTSGATSLGDVTIIDTDGDLNASGWLPSSGNIHVEARDGAITGDLSVNAAASLTLVGQGVTLKQAFGRDIVIDAGTGLVDITTYLSADRSYTVTGGDFAGNALTVNGARTGSLRITDTLGNFDFGSTDFDFAGAIRIDALNGTLNAGALSAGTDIRLSGMGVSTGMLNATGGLIDVASTQAIDIEGAHALNSIVFQAGGNLRLGGASLAGTGTNVFSLSAGGDLVFGAADPISTTLDNVFVNHGAALTGTSIHSEGDVAINLYNSDALGAIDAGTLQLAIRTGDFTAGNIRAKGALVVDGPGGTLTLGDLSSNAGHIDVRGQGNTTLGNVTGNSVINLGASAGNLAFGTLGGDDVQLTASGGITGAGVSASTLGVVAMGGDADLDHNGAGSHVASLGRVTIGNGDFILRNLQALSLDDLIEVNGTLNLSVEGALTQNAYYIVADRLQGDVTGVATLANGSNQIGALGNFSSNGLTLNNGAGIVIDGLVQGNGGVVTIASFGGMTITANGGITSSATGDAITLATDGLFTNLAGAGALSTPNGRWLVYTQTGGNSGHSDPNNDFGGLAGTSYYGSVYSFGTGGFTSAPNAGNRFVYGYRPVLTVTPSSLHLVYDGTVPNVTTTITGLVNGDSAANAWSGAAAVTGVGSNAGTYFAYSALGTLSSEMGYTFAFIPGTVIIDPRVISAVLHANDRTYDGTTNASGSLTLNGVIAGDTVTANAGNMAFDSRNAGTRTVTAGGITLSGASAGNYTVNATATDLADILARAITATLTANSRTYDGTTAATGTLALNGLIGTDDVSVGSANLAFDNRNAGTGHTVTASGITLTGADAGNYTISTSATALADIAARVITASLSANDRTYDGTTAATGTLSLNGLIGSDQVTASGNLTFDSRNAGIGRTVTANGITLSGADAGNYAISNAAVTDLADILARAITATLSANDRTYDGTTTATGALSLSGVVAGDMVSAGAGSLNFDSRNAGIGHIVTANGITLSGADAGNYTVNATATDLADILARAITATLSANGRVYDGTTLATGTLGLNGVLSGDQVSVSAGSIAFDSRNAGTRTATASGLTLSGSDAGNYTITGTASGSAVITPRALIATATADSRTYDSTTNATGRIALSGLISGDTVTGTASYRFTDANAGTGRTVLVSGLGLTGADAGNYTVSLASTPVTADITRRTITVTINDVTKLLGQPDPVLGYTISSGSLAGSDSFTGTPIRVAGDQAGRYAILQGSLALSANYQLTVLPGTLVISFTQSGADGSDALKMLQDDVGIRFSVNQNPSRNLEGDGDQGSAGDGD